MLATQELTPTPIQSPDDLRRLFRQARQASGLSLVKAAAAAKTSPRTLVLYEHGQRDPGIGTLMRMFGAVGLGLMAWHAVARKSGGGGAVAP